VEREASARVRVWEVGHAVGAHALGEGERPRGAALDRFELVLVVVYAVDTVEAVDAVSLAPPLVVTIEAGELPQPATSAAVASAATASRRTRVEPVSRNG
jgi:hypothetical protein